jgi:hypothetical protein
LDRIGLAQDKENWRDLVNMAEKIQVTQNADDLLTCCGTVTFSRTAFFFLGPVCISYGSTSAFKAYCAYPKFLTAQIHYPCVSY